MSITEIARLMFRRAVTQRAENPPTESTKLRVEALEDRNAPGSLLGEILAAARGEAASNPLDQLGWLFPSATQRPLAGVPSPVPTIRIAAGTAPAQVEALPPQLVAPQSAVGGNASPFALPSATGRVSVREEDLLFVPSTQPAIHPSAAVAGAGGMASSGGDGSTAPPLPRSSGGTASAAPEPTGSGASFILRASQFNSSPSAVSPAVDGTVSPASSVSINNYTEAELPPNTAPVANNDTASVNEDTFVVIDVLGNDTDANVGDVPRLDTWVVEAGNGVVTQQVAGQLTYTPFPDFYGTDTFTYNITDGRDTSMMSATVTVTVNSVNDAPVAFNDAFAFMHGNNPMDPATITFGSGSVLGNDFDPDGGMQQKVVYDVDTTGTVGMIAMTSFTGEFTWSGPKNYYGTTEFRYRAADAGGLVSDWAAVKLWANVTPPMSPPMSPPPMSPPPPMPVANPDAFVVGDQPVTANVMTNDTGGTVAVLQFAPMSGRVTAFGFDGTVTYARSPVMPMGDSFSYRLFGQNGMMSANTTVQMNPLNLEIYNGNGGALVSNKGKIKTEIGAFTVVNQNDTDGAFGPDNAQGNIGVIAGQKQANGLPAPGKDEVDLMQLVVNKPTGMVAGDSVIVTATGPAKFFQTSRRETDFGQTLTLGADYFQSGDIKVFWVEIYATSNELRAITIKMTYTHDGVGRSDSVKATGVWVDFAGATAFRANGQTKHADDADDKTYTTTFDTYAKNLTGFELGKPPMMTTRDFNPATGKAGFTVTLRNTMEMEFTTRPALVEKEDGGRVKFDITRTIQRTSWYQPAGGKLTPAAPDVPFPDFREFANDDDPDGKDNDNYPANQHIYSGDFPGFFIQFVGVAPPANLSGGDVRYVHRMNAQEFVRVTVNGAKLGGNGYQASRGSELVDWRSWQDWQYAGIVNTWLREPNTPQYVYNEMTLGKADRPLLP